MIKVSVIVAIYNAEKYLERCLDSLVSQTLKEIEIICVDDGSTDSSMAILKRYSELDTRVKLLQMPQNSGAAVARNSGIDIAQGKYIQIVDADDALETNALERLFQKAEENQSDLCFFRPQIHNLGVSEVVPGIIGEYGGVYKGKELLAIFAEKKEFFMYPWSVLLRRDYLNEYSIRYKPLLIGEGGEMNLRALYFAERIVVDGGRYYHYYVHQESITHRENSKLYTLIGQIHQYITMLKLVANDTDGEILEKYLSQLRTKIAGGICGLSKEQYALVISEMIDSFSRHIFESFNAKNQYIEDFAEEELSKLKDASLVMIYGAGYATNNILDLMNRYGLEIKGFVVSKLEGNPQTLFGHHVYEINQINNFDKDMLIVVAANKKYHKEIAKKLREYEFENILYLDIAI